jgi:hypothetical protein
MIALGSPFLSKIISNMVISYIFLLLHDLGFGMVLKLLFLSFIKVLVFCPVNILVYPFGPFPGFPLC